MHHLLCRSLQLWYCRIMVWITYALLAAIFAAVMTILAKVGLNKVDPTLATALRSIVMAVFFVATTAIFGKFQLFHQVDKRALVFIIGSGLAGALSWLFYFLALKVGPATGTTVLDRLSLVFVAILAAVFLRESLDTRSIVGIILVVAGAALMIWR